MNFDEELDEEQLGEHLYAALKRMGMNTGHSDFVEIAQSISSARREMLSKSVHIKRVLAKINNQTTISDKEKEKIRRAVWRQVRLTITKTLNEMP